VTFIDRDLATVSHFSAWASDFADHSPWQWNLPYASKPMRTWNNDDDAEQQSVGAKAVVDPLSLNP